MKKILITVIIPNYNHHKYLEKRIISILNQSYKNIEVIILDDCSTDNSREIIENYREHEKISHIIYNKVNTGSAFKQWKKGIELAKGEWIWIAESDDVADLSFLENFYKYFHIDTSIIFSRSYLIDECDKIIGELPPKEIISGTYLFDGITFIESFMISTNIIPNASSVIFNKSVYDKTINNIENLKVSGDYNLWLKLAKKGSIQYIDLPLNYFRCHQENIRTKYNSFDTYIKESKINLRALEEIIPNKYKIIDMWIYQTIKQINNHKLSYKDWLNLLLILFNYKSILYFFKSYVKA